MRTALFASSTAVVLAALVLTGCGELSTLQAATVVHPASTFDPYVESFNQVLDDQLETTLDTPLLTGYEGTIMLYGFIGGGITRFDGASEATLENGTIRGLDISGRDAVFRTAIPFYALGAAGSEIEDRMRAPISFQIESDVIMRKTTVQITETPVGGETDGLYFESTDVVFRPSLVAAVRGSAFVPGSAARLLSVRGSVGYDIPLAADGFDATFSGFLAREYTAEDGSLTYTGEEQQPGLRGLHARIGLTLGL